MSNLATVQPTQLVNNIGEMQQMATALAASGYFKDAKDSAQAFVKILAGHELGIPPFAAMSGVHIIQGKPELGANILASLVKSSGKYDYRPAQIDNTICVIKFFERRDGAWEELGKSSFSLDDAKAAGTQNLGKFPRNMLFARAISNGVKWFCPEITSGMACYTEGEIGGAAIPQLVDGQLVDGDADHAKEQFKSAIEMLRKSEAVDDIAAAHEIASQHAITDRAKATLKAEHDKAIARIRGSINPPSDNPLEAIAKPVTAASDDF